MRKNIILGLALLTAFLLAGNAEAGNTIDTSNINVMAYYNPGTSIDLSKAIQEFDFVTESTGQYVEGKLRIWYDNPESRNPGNIQDFERRDGADTSILFASNVSVRVRSDGWIVAWLTNDQNLTDIVFWDEAKSANLPSNTTLGKAIWRITDRVGANYNKSEVKYYSYKYPAADRLLIGGRVTTAGGETYSFLMPSTNTVYDAKFLWIANLIVPICYDGCYGYVKVKINTTYIYNKGIGSYGLLYEYARYYQDIINFPRDTRHTVYMESRDPYYGPYYGYGSSVLKSAVAVLYKSG